MKNFKHDQYVLLSLLFEINMVNINQFLFMFCVNDRATTRHTIDQVKILFSEHPDLFDGFQNFLPVIV